MKKILLIILQLMFVMNTGSTQEVWFFSEGTSAVFYDQGIVDKSSLGASTFEYTYPPGLPQYNDKIPCSSTAYKGSSSLKFNYMSAAGGNWKVTVFRNDWSTVSVSGLDSLSCYIYSASELPASSLPLIGLLCLKTGGSGEISSSMYKLSDFNGSIPAGKWKRITFPLQKIISDPLNSNMNFSAAKGVIFSQSEFNNTARTILVDEITAFKGLSVVPPVINLAASGYDSHAELTWTRPVENLAFRIYASFDAGSNWSIRGETTGDYYLDFVPPAGRNRTVAYRVTSITGGKESEARETSVSIRDYSDDELLDMVQRYTFRYFWEGAHQASGMALERTDGSNTTVASGGTGMGLMAMIAAFDRGYKPREEIKDRIIKILSFLETCPRPHGAWAHWYNAGTGQIQPFSADDDGGDLVETSFVAQALIALKNYFSDSSSKSVQIREKADQLWKGIEWDWYRQNDQKVLYWHWSPTKGFKINMKVTGWNECLITYIMAASSPAHGIPREVYTEGWAGNGNMVNKRTFYNYEINLSPDWGGPLFWLHYSHLGIDPRGLKDTFADYWKEHVNTVLIHHAYAVANPKGHKNYSEKCWGLTASDDPYGYTDHKPVINDNGTISPTAALASIPYAPAEALKALKYFYRERGNDLFGKYGPYDAFNDNLNWVKKAWLAIDQGPVIIMIENYRSGLLWKNVMKDPSVKQGLEKLGIITGHSEFERIDPTQEVILYPNPCKGKFRISDVCLLQPARIELCSTDGRLAFIRDIPAGQTPPEVDCSGLPGGVYGVRFIHGNEISLSKLVILK